MIEFINKDHQTSKCILSEELSSKLKDNYVENP